MATKILMPQLGESVTEGTISKWLVSVGDQVNKYDPICEVITDKVNAEVPSSISGTVVEIIAQEDETVPVGGVICLIQDTQEGQVSSNAEGASNDFTQKEVTPEATNEELHSNTRQAQTNHNTRYSPAVLKLAQEHNVELSDVTGTGFNGRVTRKDIQNYIQSGKPKKPIAAPVVEKSTQSSISIAPTLGDLEIPVTPIRRAIAQRMTMSKHEAPHAWMTIEVDVTNLVQLRQKTKDDFRKKEGLNLTYLPFFIKAAVDAIKEYPIINSQWAGDKIIQKKDINISIAVATDDALFVPVIKKADEKSIIGLARSIDDLARRTREGKLSQDDITGGTFTVNNTGSFGSILSTPIINYPQAAILSVEAIVKRPVIYDNMIAIRDIVNVCFSLDHRILDGLVSGRFLQSIKQKIESISEDTVL